ncbi:hypothetical protein H7J73_29965 [Mycolicibacterium komossense]|uniref:Predicted hydrolase N-terminal domain-containing protein n=1 Tax=Mycolicibacterium komossense TaxID=1779 RepID=A0ABT3CLF3_9MYCO|nr:hypothetical protein [Mycolicibacterium komossense]MCV7230242.1 hypothetical protein [Mycolicibacterium komossense]
MTFQKDQLPRIAIDLEGLAAALAEAERFASNDISVLDSQLHYLDALIDEALAHDEDTSALESDAINVTTQILGQIGAIRDDYSAKLTSALTTLREDGYDPGALQGLDDDGNRTHAQQDQAAVGKYGDGQRVKDQAMVDSPGPWTPEKADAAKRLQDFATATNPGATADSRHLASERLDDYDKSRFTGPLSVDPLLGGTAADRARMRLDWQKKMEQGLLGMPPMTADQATQALDDAEHGARVLVTQKAIEAFQRQGLSADGAKTAVEALGQGVPWRDLLNQDSQLLGGLGAGADAGTRVIKSESETAHALGRFSEADLTQLKSISGKLGLAGLGLDTGLGLYDIVANHAPAWQTAGQVAGGAATSYAVGVGAWALAGTWIGPEGAVLTGLVGAVVLSPYGSKYVGELFGNLDG